MRVRACVRGRWVVDLARFSPSWKNTQIARYVAVEDEALKNRIAEEATIPWSEGIIKGAPVLMVMTYVEKRCGYERDGSFSTSKGDRWQNFDCGIAAATFELAAHELGLGSVVLGIFFTWFVGTALEREWGDFRYTVYLLSGVLGTVLGCLLTGVTASTYCLSLSLLLAFAMLYPELQVLLFFVIPLKVKYFGIFAAALWGFSFLSMGMLGKLNYLLCMLGFLLFFGPQAWHNIRAWVRREQWKRKNRR